jgi:hypothetical protein
MKKTVLTFGLISGACCVATWEIVYYKLMPGFAEK